MICESCRKYEATTIYTHIVENKKKTVHLCSFCASKDEDTPTKGAGPAMSGKKMVVELNLAAAEEASSAQCAECGMTYEEFRKAGRFGCKGCYTAFEEQLERLLKQIHGSVRHQGKGRIEQRELLLPAEEIAQLRQDIETAIAEEAFERAAQLRDRIIQLEKKATAG